MTINAEGARYWGTVWRGEKPWYWIAVWSGRTSYVRRWHLYRGSSPAIRHWRAWRCWTWHLHLTPLHVEHQSSTSELGLCWGTRTIFLMRHR